MDEMTEVTAPAEQSPAPEPQAEPAKTEDAPRSRLDSIEKAFKDMGVEDDPEPASQGDTDAEKAETKPKAEDKPEAKAEKAEDDGPARGPDGKFVAKDGEKEVEAKDDAKQEKTPLADPPSRFSSDAKEAWKDAPEAIRAETHRMLRELEGGLQKKDAQLEPLKPYYEMAEKHGVKLESALANYVNMENMLRQDPAQGLQVLARNMGMSPQQLAQTLMGEQGDGKQDPRDQEITRLHNELQQFKQQFSGLNQTVQSQQEATIAQQIQQFAADKPHFDMLSQDIAGLLQSGQAQGLEDAYEIALQKAQKYVEQFAPQQPAPEPEQPQAPAAQTRPALSVTGAPNAGSNPGNRQPSKNRNEALSRAFQRVGLA